MQYILSEDEYAALVPLAKYQAQAAALVAAREVIVELNGGKCVHAAKDSGKRLAYCDRCPIIELRWEQRAEICDLEHHFSQ